MEELIKQAKENVEMTIKVTKEIHKSLAELYMEMFNNFIDVGFTGDQAMTLISNFSNK